MDEKLQVLANAAARAQEKEHNEPHAPKADAKIKAFEDEAKNQGYEKVIWPGLYPVCFKDGQQFTIS